MPDDGEGPGDKFDRASVRTELRRALDRLPAGAAEAFLMHYVEGVSYDEMAGLLEASVSALKMRVRARESLAAQLRDREVTSQAPSRLSVKRSEVAGGLVKVRELL